MLTLLTIYQAVQKTDQHFAALTYILLDYRLARDQQVDEIIRT